MIPQKKIEQAAKEINPYTPGLHRTAFNEGFTAGVRFAESEIGQIAQEFAEWCGSNGWVLDHRIPENTRYSTKWLYDKFMAERAQK